MNRLAILVLLAACAHQASPPRGHMEHGMAKCPSAIPGANTYLALTSDGVDLAITSEVPDIQRAIVEIAGFQTQMGEPGGSGMHTGQHGGTGHDGFCPIVHNHSIVTSSPRPDGVTIHVRAESSDRVPDLQAETRVRLDHLTVAR